MRSGFRHAAATAVAVALATVGGWYFASPPAGALAPSQHAWWQQAQQLPSQLPAGAPAPPMVGPGGLYVANTPAGPSGISALRFESETPAAGQLTLTVEEKSRNETNSQNTGALATVQACMVHTNWKAEENGPWVDVPIFECVGVRPVVTTDGVTMTWNIPASFQDPQQSFVDVILAPDPEAKPFEVAFEQPGAGSFTQVQAGEEAPPQLPPDEPPADFGPTVTPSSVPLPTDSGFDAFTPLAAAPSPAEATGVPRPRLRPRAVVPAAAFHDTSRRQRIEAASLLLTILAAWFWLAGEPTRAPRLLGSVGGAARAARAAERAGAPRGLGRFSRPRTGPPPKLG